MTPEEKFQSQLTDPKHSDISPHLYTLRRYAAASRSVVEMGTSDGSSALAFLLARPDWVITYDLWRLPEVDQLEVWARELGVEFEMHAEDSRVAIIPDCDLLFLDTDHVTETLLTELQRHSPKVKKYILMHDTQVCGERSCQVGGSEKEWIGPGLWQAISEFLRNHDEWQLGWVMHEHPGLTCLNRVK